MIVGYITIIAVCLNSLMAGNTSSGLRNHLLDNSKKLRDSLSQLSNHKLSIIMDEFIQILSGGDAGLVDTVKLTYLIYTLGKELDKMLYNAK